MHGAIGWGLCEIFDSGKTPGDYSKEELTNIFKRNKKTAEKEKERYDNAMAELPPEARADVKNLSKKLNDKTLSNAEKDKIVNKISSIFERHGVENVLDD